MLEKEVAKLNKDKEQATADIQILVKEVADRHDVISNLRTEVNVLEDKLKQMDTHVQFKDEIIKDLRKKRKLLSKVTALR